MRPPGIPGGLTPQPLEPFGALCCSCVTMSDLDLRALWGQALTEDEFVKQSTEYCSNLGGATHSGTHSTRPPER